MVKISSHISPLKRSNQVIVKYNLGGVQNQSEWYWSFDSNSIIGSETKSESATIYNQIMNKLKV